MGDTLAGGTPHQPFSQVSDDVINLSVNESKMTTEATQTPPPNSNLYHVKATQTPPQNSNLCHVTPEATYTDPTATYSSIHATTHDLMYVCMYLTLKYYLTKS